MPRGGASSNTHALVNPFVEGPVAQDLVKNGGTPDQAAIAFNKVLQGHYSGSPSDSYMTIASGDNKLSHYRVERSAPSGDDEPEFSYKIYRLQGEFPSNVEKSLKKLAVSGDDEPGSSKQSGGAPKDGDVEERLDRMMQILQSIQSKSSGRDSYLDGRYATVLIDQPITRFVYYHLPYYLIDASDIDPYRRHRLFAPTFYFPVELEFDLNMY